MKQIRKPPKLTKNNNEVITAQLNIQWLDYLVYMCRIKFCSGVFLLFENFVFSVCHGLKKLKWPKWLKLPNQTSISQYFWYTLENKFSLRIFVLLLIIFFLSRGDKKTKKLLKYKNLSVRGMGNILAIGQTLMILIFVSNIENAILELLYYFCILAIILLFQYNIPGWNKNISLTVR